MKIAIDVSPIKNNQHKVRGSGFYLVNLLNAFHKFFPNNSYIEFVRGEKIPKDVDIVHFPYFEAFFLTIPFFNNKKSVITIHDLTPLVFPKEFPSGIKGKFKWIIQKKFLKKINGIITDSYSSKNDIHKIANVPLSEISVVYLAAGDNFNNIKLAKERVHELQKKYNLPQDFTLYVGDVTWNKNLPRLIQAMIDLNKPLVLIGKALSQNNYDSKNPWNNDLKRAQLLAEGNENIKIIGFVNEEDLIDLYKMATIFCMPSIYEGFGLPVLEAMKSGTAVVTSDRGSLKEVAGNAALYINPESIEDIKAGINKLLENTKLRESYIEKGVKQAKSFTWKKTAEDTIKVYEKILERK